VGVFKAPKIGLNPTMIYCIGLKSKYDAALAAGPYYKHGRGVRKSGWNSGGMVFQTVADAQAFLDATPGGDLRDVYGLEADWDTDTAAFDGEPFRRLTKKTADIVKLP